MTRAELADLRRRFGFACGYCGVSETGVGAALTIDHFQPTACGGLDEVENWIYCCAACNSFKGAYWSDESDAQLLKPLRDDFSTHIEMRGDQAVGLTPRGTAHIEKLHLNREQLRAQRVDLQEQQQLQERLRRAEERLERALKRIEDVENQR